MIKFRIGARYECKKTQKRIFQNKIDKGFNTTDINKEYSSRADEKVKITAESSSCVVVTEYRLGSFV
jgi:hypothetical protein